MIVVFMLLSTLVLVFKPELIPFAEIAEYNEMIAAYLIALMLVPLVRYHFE